MMACLDEWATPAGSAGPPRSAHNRDTPAASFGPAGAPATRLLAGPVAEAGSEQLSDHVSRLGPAPIGAFSTRNLIELVLASGLTGRGGGEFPTGKKLETVASRPGGAVVVVNASESEPASRKDRHLLELRSHLVLDGAAIVAAALRARVAVIYSHQGRDRCLRAVAQALAERAAAGVGDPDWRITLAPDRYVAGESTAVISHLEGMQAIPRKQRLPVAEHGVSGRPTFLSNAETFAHIALIARHGAAWFREAGSARSPGSTLVTLTGAVDRPGTVLELASSAPFAALLSYAGTITPPPALLIGGYAGRWVAGERAWHFPCDRGALSSAGVRLGCGIIGALAPGACGLAETVRLLEYLAGETAGQCGPCVFGLPALAAAFAELAAGAIRPSGLRTMQRRMAIMRRSGACAHPDGAILLAESALHVFADDVSRHLKGRACPVAKWAPSFPLPVPGEQR